MTQLYTLTPEALMAFISRLINETEYAVYGPVKAGDLFAFEELKETLPLRLGYTVTRFSPVKERLLPEGEVLRRYRLLEDGYEYSVDIPTDRVILVGVHPYDIASLKKFDAVYGRDPFYAARRANLMIVGLDVNIPPPNSFCVSMGTHVVHEGFDLMLTELGGKYVVEIGTCKGKELFFKFAHAVPATKEEVGAREEHRERVARMYPQKLPVRREDLPALLRDKKDHPFWEKAAATCFGCLACTTVCPTCTCYSIKERMPLGETDGCSMRCLDSCLNPTFAEVAGNHKFLVGCDHMKRRMMDKLSYVVTRHGELGCTGCGRCTRECLTGIANPVNALNKLMHQE